MPQSPLKSPKLAKPKPAGPASALPSLGNHRQGSGLRLPLLPLPAEQPMWPCLPGLAHALLLETVSNKSSFNGSRLPICWSYCASGFLFIHYILKPAVTLVLGERPLGEKRENPALSRQSPASYKSHSEALAHLILIPQRSRHRIQLPP